MELEKKVIAEEKINGAGYVIVSEDLVQRAVAFKLIPKQRMIQFYAKSSEDTEYLPTSALAFKIHFRDRNIEGYEMIHKSESLQWY